MRILLAEDEPKVAGQWQYNLTDIPGNIYSKSGSNFTLAANQVTATKSGTYSVVFSNIVGSTVVVNQEAYNSYWAFGAPPVVAASPVSTNAASGANVTLSTSATVQQNPYGTNLLLGFLWYWNNTNLVSVQTSPGTNQTASLTLTNLNATNAGNYTVVVTNFWGSVTSSPAALTITSSATPPGISGQPSAKSILAGQNASFSVTATGTAPLSYQWQRNGTNLANGGVFSGVNTNLLILNSPAIDLAGNYSVVVTNTAGATNSSNAALNVSLPPNLNAGSLLFNRVQLSASTVTGLSYVVEKATNLTAPISWIPISTNAVPPGGSIQVTNTATNSQQYFRLSFP